MPEILAFYLWPPFWIMNGAPADAVRDASAADEEVGRYSLSTGLVASVRRDGLVVFDFSGRPDCVRPGPQETVEDADTTLAASLAPMRVCMTILNAHLACFFAAQHACAQAGTASTDMYMKTNLGVDDLLALPDLRAAISDFGGPHGSTLRYGAAHARGLIGREAPLDDTYSQHGQRDGLEIVVVDESMRLLDKLLTSLDALSMANLMLQAARSFEQLDFPTALVTAWSVAEKGVVSLWEGYLESHQAPLTGAGVAITGDRRDLLLGRDYTASIRIETLALLAEIGPDLYADLTAARKARNRWLHSLREVSPSDADRAISAAEVLLQRIHNVDLSMVRSYGSGPYDDSWVALESEDFDAPMDALGEP